MASSSAKSCRKTSTVHHLGIVLALLLFGRQTLEELGQQGQRNDHLLLDNHGDGRKEKEKEKE
jgi:hypothetical protein